jgi:phage gp29-like protein
MVSWFALESSRDFANFVDWVGMPRVLADFASAAAGIARAAAGIARAAAGIAKAGAEFPRPTLAQRDQEADMLEGFAGLGLGLIFFLFFGQALES